MIMQPNLLAHLYLYYYATQNESKIQHVRNVPEKLLSKEPTTYTSSPCSSLSRPYRWGKTVPLRSTQRWIYISTRTIWGNVLLLDSPRQPNYGLDKEGREVRVVGVGIDYDEKLTWHIETNNNDNSNRVDHDVSPPGLIIGSLFGLGNICVLSQ